jgi:hypothetical protein
VQHGDPPPFPPLCPTDSPLSFIFPQYQEFPHPYRAKITYKVTVSVLEIYQDKITDLLEDKYATTFGRIWTRMYWPT